MKTKDPLDTQINSLLASRPLRPSDDFIARVLEAAEADAVLRRKRSLGRRLAFALPLAAAFALTFSLLQLDIGQGIPDGSSTALTQAEVQELFLLQEGLANLASVGSTDFGSKEMLRTLDALYLEI
ncbi:MAG: hypothetical protein H8E75_02040 [Puniceicoccaceae bacterium]|nr:hypothetical protein [Puniceicoccaceae bacterium]HAY99492.1 hypothetical protein [Opitutae bacterium]